MNDGVYVVTGASRGIGAAVVRMLALRGERVIAIARHEEALQAIWGKFSNVTPVAADCSSDSAVEAIARVLDASGLAVSGFVHAAGFVSPAPLGLIDFETTRRLYAVHAVFPLQFFGWFARQAHHTPGAAAVLLSSLACHEGDCGNAAYASAKGAVEGMVKSAASELVTRGIRLNALVLGVVDTPMSHEAWMDNATPERLASMEKSYPLGFGTPENVAEIVDFLLSPAARWITGQCLVADGGHQARR